MIFETAPALLVRLVESASDELARLDALCSLAPKAVAEHLRLAAIAQLANSSEGTPFAHASLAAAVVDAAHAALLPPDVERWMQIADTEERRARSGAPLTAARVLAWLPGGSPASLAALDDALRPGGAPRAVLLRAVSAAAVIRTAALQTTAALTADAHSTDVHTAALHTGALHTAAELLPPLMLCAAGNTDRIRLLPFAALDAAARDESLEAWGEGDASPFAQLALAECARAARAERQAVAAAIAGIPAEDARLDALGRAAITARRALAVLRQAIGTTVPALATELACSRPAAGDALARLVDLHLAQEITGRGRDRVFVWSTVHRPS